VGDATEKRGSQRSVRRIDVQLAQIREVLALHSTRFSRIEARSTEPSRSVRLSPAPWRQKVCGPRLQDYRLAAAPIFMGGRKLPIFMSGASLASKGKPASRDSPRFASQAVALQSEIEHTEGRAQAHPHVGRVAVLRWVFGTISFARFVRCASGERGRRPICLRSLGGAEPVVTCVCDSSDYPNARRYSNDNSETGEEFAHWTKHLISPFTGQGNITVPS
jgi:hypothetical protein